MQRDFIEVGGYGGMLGNYVLLLGVCRTYNYMNNMTLFLTVIEFYANYTLLTLSLTEFVFR